VSRKELKNKPLVEAIFELRWNLKETAPGIKIDPHYKLLIGRLYDKFQEEYKFHEQLLAAAMPDEMAGYMVQHRFRKNKNEWPLIQLGPGIITFNDTEGYVWEDFKNKIIIVLDNLFELYPDAEDNLKVNSLLLRYIDAINFDFEKDDIFKFLKEKMKVNITLYPKLFEDTGIDRISASIDLRFSFPSTKPKGVINLRFARGKKEGTDALIWETMVRSTAGDAPGIKENIVTWLVDSHNLTNDWFFKLIEGELLRRFE